ncbi:hypothetical protein L7F22_002674 [Adiantum nelumboides]|nr:hypothetical protein [Adiantum nelumboides]
MPARRGAGTQQRRPPLKTTSTVAWPPDNERSPRRGEAGVTWPAARSPEEEGGESLAAAHNSQARGLSQGKKEARGLQ